nr:immunity 51 family protein [Paenibacillus silagei]
MLEKLKEAEIGGAVDLKPFIIVEQDNGGKSVILSVGNYKTEVFAAREEEGFEGNGYDWGSLAAVFLEEKMPELAGIIHFDPEAGMYCAYSSDGEALVAFATAFKLACEDDVLIRDLFSRAELD